MGEGYLMEALKARRIKRKARVQRIYLCVFFVRHVIFEDLRKDSQC